jgi:hypothetical protein
MDVVVAPLSNHPELIPVAAEWHFRESDTPIPAARSRGGRPAWPGKPTRIRYRGR